MDVLFLRRRNVFRVWFKFASRGTVIFLFVCVVAGNTEKGFKEGGPCTRTTDNATGVCRQLNDCPDVYPKPGIFVREKPEICGIRKQVTIVCCVPKAPLSPEQVVALSLNSPTNNYIAYSAPVSERKCREYAKFVYEKITDNKGDNAGERDRCVRPADSTKPGAAVQGEFPFMALLIHEHRETGEINSFCGGTLISERYVLTSAVCATQSSEAYARKRKLFVVLGELTFQDESDGAPTQQILVTQTINHPDFVLSRSYNDIALLLLEHPAKLSHVRPACLPHGESLRAESFIATGWGFTSPEFDKGGNKLMKVSLVLAPFSVCDIHWPVEVNGRSPLGLHRPSQMCAGHPNKKNGVCNGDGGGPLLVKSSSEYCTHHVVGIVSFGRECGTEPDVFTRVAYYVRWIENIIWS